MVAERICAGVAEFDLPNAKADTPSLTVRIGLVTLQGGEYGAPALVACADAQRYAAKQVGRNRVCATELPPSVAPL